MDKSLLTVTWKVLVSFKYPKPRSDCFWQWDLFRCLFIQFISAAEEVFCGVSLPSVLNPADSGKYWLRKCLARIVIKDPELLFAKLHNIEKQLKNLLFVFGKSLQYRGWIQNPFVCEKPYSTTIHGFQPCMPGVSITRYFSITILIKNSSIL